jgi:hypothetical protein
MSGSSTPPSSTADKKEWTFITSTNDLSMFKDKDTMNTVRHKVMVNYLTDGQRSTSEPSPQPRPKQQVIRPAQRDASRNASVSRDAGAGQPSTDVTLNDYALKLFRQETAKGKRRRSERSPSDSSSAAEPKRIRQEDDEDEDYVEEIDQAVDRSLSLNRYQRALSVIQFMRRHRIPLVTTPDESQAPFIYDRHFSPDTYTPLKLPLVIGNTVDPWHTLPQASTAEIPIEQLKWQCSQYYGTKGMGRHWVPTMLKTPAAFLSTLCVASIQRDIINGKHGEGRETFHLRLEVVHYISQTITNSRSSVDDATIMAVLQLLASDLIRGETRELLWHEDGMERMVESRGGLDALETGGDLAGMMTT